MRAGDVWWRRIGHSIRFTENVAHAMADERGLILALPEKMPWKETFYQVIDEKWRSLHIDRHLERVEWREPTARSRPVRNEVGTFVLRHLCDPRESANYFPGRSCAEYLGKKEDLTMNDSYIWVTNIRTRESLQKWVSFVREYESHARSLSRMAVFILEYTGPAQTYDGVPQCAYQVEECHGRVFCLEMQEIAEKNQPQWMRNYMTELVLRNGRNDPELCERLLQQGEALLRKPEETLLQVLPAYTGERALRLRPEIVSNIREAMMVFLFPLLERCRLRFVARYSEVLAPHLPVQNPMGDPIDLPQDLEWGQLWWLSRNVHHLFPTEEAQRVDRCRSLRNDLAHTNSPLIEFERIDAFMRYDA